jgi:ABC-type transport system involved in cytochrome c biogenesis permease subunit
MHLEKITLTCFGASYAVALLLEVLHLLGPRTVPRFLGLLFGAAGLLAHTLFLVQAFFLAEQGPPLSSQLGSTLFLAWILAIFYLYGTVHHCRQAWAVFVLPVVLILILLAVLFPLGREESAGSGWFQGKQLWSLVHAGLLILAAAGVCVAAVASIMYLVQARRLRDKVPPRQGMRLLNLERLEEMNRRAITLAFPLLTAGLLIGLFRVARHLSEPPVWTDPRVLGAAVLWVVFALLLYLRYGAHLRGRRLALLTIVTFVLLLFTLAASHTGVQGGSP